MQLWPVEKGTCVVLQVPFCEEKSVQLVRVASFRSDFLQNPYFSWSSLFWSGAPKFSINITILVLVSNIEIKYFMGYPLFFL